MAGDGTDDDDIKAVFRAANAEKDERAGDEPKAKPKAKRRASKPKAEATPKAEAEKTTKPRAKRTQKKRKSPGRVRLFDISPRAWEHPTDRAALSGLRKITGFDRVLKAFAGLVSERSLRLLFLANAVRVNGDQFSDLHQLLIECCDVLDYGEVPELYVTQTPLVNAGCVGIDKPFLVLNSGLLELLDHDELRFVIGHELGHALSGHALYRTMLAILLNLGMRIGLPVANAVLVGVVLALQEWARKAELSCDRAGLLCLQDPEVAYRVQMKMAGGKRTGEMSLDSFVEQAREYENDGDVFDSALKLLMLLRRSHPFPVLRLAELKRWVDSGEYEKVIAGDFPKRSSGASDIREDVTAGAEHFRERWTKRDDALSRLVQDVGGALGELGTTVRDIFKRGGGDDAGDDDAAST